MTEQEFKEIILMTVNESNKNDFAKIMKMIEAELSKDGSEIDTTACLKIIEENAPFPDDEKLIMGFLQAYGSRNNYVRIEPSFAMTDYI